MNTHTATDERLVAAAVAAPAPAVGYAGLVTRTLAFAADAVVVEVAAALVGGVVAVATSLFDLPDDLQKVLAVAGVVAGALWTVGYFVAFWSTSGQTPGNRLMRIRVQDAETGRPPGLLRAVARFGALVLAILIVFMGILVILLDGRRRGLHDIMAGTVVVDVDAREQLAQQPVDLGT